MLRFVDDAQEQQLFAGSSVENAEGSGGQLPERRGEAVEFFELSGRNGAMSQTDKVSFDPPAKRVRNGQ